MSVKTDSDDDIQCWSTVRKRALRRDQYRCQSCGRCESNHQGVDLHVHHILPKKDGGNDTLDNAITLCKSCHNRLHAHCEDDNELLEPSLLDEIDIATFAPVEYRKGISELPDRASEIISLLKQNGPMQIKDIIAEFDVSRGTIYSSLKSLKISFFVCRVERGVYAYVTTSEYREMLARGRDKHGGYQVTIWDPGTQSKITDFIEET